MRDIILLLLFLGCLVPTLSVAGPWMGIPLLTLFVLIVDQIWEAIDFWRKQR